MYNFHTCETKLAESRVGTKYNKHSNSSLPTVTLDGPLQRIRIHFFLLRVTSLKWILDSCYDSRSWAKTVSHPLLAVIIFAKVMGITKLGCKKIIYENQSCCIITVIIDFSRFTWKTTFPKTNFYIILKYKQYIGSVFSSQLKERMLWISI